MSELAPPKPAVTEGSTDEGLDVEPGPTPAFPEAPELKLGKEDEVIAQGQFELVLPRVAEATVREAVHGPEPSVMIGGFPWRFMVYPKGNGSNAVGVFLELDAKCDAMPTGEYTIFVSCVLEVVSTVDDRWNKGKRGSAVARFACDPHLRLLRPVARPPAASRSRCRVARRAMARSPLPPSSAPARLPSDAHTTL